MSDAVVTTKELMDYWTQTQIGANFIILLNILGALLLGAIVGYERYYHGRAAGMRTYGFVCMASAALVVVGEYTSLWYGGHGPIMTNADPTRVIQGIIQGIGFLGAGMVMKDGFSISGLTTAAGIWASAAIGILIGLGMYGAGIGMAIISAVGMTAIGKIEKRLPTYPAISVMLIFKEGFTPKADVLSKASLDRGYRLVDSTLTTHFDGKRHMWRFTAVSTKNGSRTLSELSEELARFDGVEEHEFSHARN